MSDGTLIFVYGTLKRGGSNHSFMAGQSFLGNATSAPGFCLIDLGDFPGLVACAEARNGVAGEVWSVDKTCLAALDRLEGVDEGLYRRAAIPLLPPFQDADVDTYFFAGSTVGRDRVTGGAWPSADS